MKHMWKKTMIMGSLTAILSAGLILPASASAATSNNDWSAQLQDWLKNSGYTVTTSNGTTTITKTVGTAPQAATPAPATPTKKPTASVKTPTKPAKTTKKPTAATQKPSSTTPAKSAASDKSAFAAEVVKLVNQERSKQGLAALTSNAKLSDMALVKAKDMNTNKYFSHTSPTYGSPFDMMSKFGITYSYAGENIAMGQQTPSEVMTAWMNSDGHRKNIMSANYTQIGVAYYNGYWVQEFIAK